MKKPLNVSIDASLKEKLKFIALKEGISLKQHVENILKKYIIDVEGGCDGKNYKKDA